MENKEKECYLVLDLLEYDKISFERKGFKNKNELESYFSIETETCEGDNDHKYRVILRYRGDKKDEYEIEVIISGYFCIEGCNDEEKEKSAIKYSTISILMPFLRSQVANLTTQFNVDPVLLPVINIDNFVDKYYENKDNKEEN